MTHPAVGAPLSPASQCSVCSGRSLKRLLGGPAELGSPVSNAHLPFGDWPNIHLESLKGKLREELLERKAFDTLLEADLLGARWE
jgi:hypothetical protein